MDGILAGCFPKSHLRLCQGHTQSSCDQKVHKLPSYDSILSSVMYGSFHLNLTVIFIYNRTLGCDKNKSSSCLGNFIVRVHWVCLFHSFESLSVVCSEESLEPSWFTQKQDYITPWMCHALILCIIEMGQSYPMSHFLPSLHLCRPFYNILHSQNK